ncbi:unnamed protein product [Fraxinus pennsylvanica]|uniref:Hexosyltransferase n=1 Tax=Fraxinus pennsylvanica TaxID=56036 RepID=A0AAD1YVP4_9LAMI|nr:unnamed protein product [Fraxinus pennsylvanica]
MVVDIDKWRKGGYSQKVEEWMTLQKQKRIYRLGSLPPILLVFAANIKAVDHRWNRHGLGGDTFEDNRRRLHPGPISLLHWSGKGKPWLRLDSRKPCTVDYLCAPSISIVYSRPVCISVKWLKIKARNASSSLSSNTVDGDTESAQQLFEKLKEIERERMNKLEKFEREANVQLERLLAMASEWSRALLTMRGKLKGIERDPATLEASRLAEFLILQTGITAFGKAYYIYQNDLVPNLAA